jgi:hypothetical protein
MDGLLALRRRSENERANVRVCDAPGWYPTPTEVPEHYLRRGSRAWRPGFRQLAWRSGVHRRVARFRLLPMS